MIHRLSILSMLLLLISTVTCFSQAMEFSGPNSAELLQGKSYSVSWLSSGGETISLVVRGTNTPLGSVSRGEFTLPLAEKIPAAQGQLSFVMPWIDASKFTLMVKEYDGAGHLVATSEREYGFRPAILKNRLEDGIFLDLHQRIDQRLYVQKDRRITRIYICSSSENYHWLPPNVHPSGPHDHAGVFKVLEKNPDHYSKLYKVHMFWALQYLGGHFVHATSPNLYKYLGRPASHGCNRLTRYDAKKLYDSTPVGTRVEVIGPKG